MSGCVCSTVSGCVWLCLAVSGGLRLVSRSLAYGGSGTGSHKNGRTKVLGKIEILEINISGIILHSSSET